MNNKNRIQIYLFVVIGFALILTNSCEKDEKSSKKDPVITWENPADITYGTLLSTIQLNATADVSGTFIYTPAIGTKLNEGANQDLKVDFTPTDAINYNSINKTVKINVTASIIGTVTDIDGNVYKTVKIGNQWWMAENLKVTKYKDGSAIPNVTKGTLWNGLTTGAYCNYDNKESNVATYGRLYNWYAINTGNLCPTGWHVPTDAEWTTLIDYLGGTSVAGGKLKETGTTHWNSPNTGATNETGFTALPGGYRGINGAFFSIGYYGYWCSATESNANYAWYRYMDYNYSLVYRSISNKQYGFSVRCLRD